MTTIIRGIPQTRAALARVEAEIKVAAPAAARAGAEIIGRAAQSRAPRNTGVTASSITVSSDGEMARVGPTTAYARFPEFGTVHMAGQHYMQEAADASQGSIVAAVAAILKTAIQ